MRYLILAFLALSSLLEARPQDFTAFGPRLSADYRFDMRAFLPADRLSLPELEERVAGLQSYEEFLDYLAKRRPKLFESPVFIHDSGSLQYADRENPRVILFGDGLMLAFAEDPSSDERTVEVIAFDGKSFKFAELNFAQYEASIQKDPKNCQSCHGVNGKPLWDPYDFWPNAYGRAIARFKTDDEKKAYDGVRLNPSKKGIYARLQFPLPPANNNSGLDGIEAFTQYVTQLQIFASLQRWQSEVNFRPMVPALLAVLNQCAAYENDKDAARQLATFFPAAWKSLIEAGFPATHQRVKDERKKFIEYQIARYRKLFPSGKIAFPINHDRLAGETLTTAQFFFVLDLAGVNTQDFAMSQGLNPYMLSVPSNFDFDLGTDFTLVAQGLFQKLTPAFSNGGGYGYTWTVFDCKKLQEESLQQLQNVKVSTPPLTKFQPAPTVLGECMGCHSVDASNRGVPEIPFDRTAALRDYLKADNNTGLYKILERIGKSGAGQMPPYRNLTINEKEQLKNNLKLMAD
jgi:mono/diheme cytochrome c family protein